MVDSLEIAVPCVERIRLIGINRWIPIKQVEWRVCRTGHRGDLYPGNQVAGCSIIFFDFPLEFRRSPGVGVKADIKSVGIGYVTTIGNSFKRRISDAH